MPEFELLCPIVKLGQG